VAAANTTPTFGYYYQAGLEEMSATLTPQDTRNTSSPLSEADCDFYTEFYTTYLKRLNSSSSSKIIIKRGK